MPDGTPELLASGPEPAARRRPRRGFVLAGVATVAAVVVAAAVVLLTRAHDTRRTPDFPVAAGSEIPISGSVGRIEEDGRRRTIRIELNLFNTADRAVLITRVGADAAPIVLQIVSYAVTRAGGGSYVPTPPFALAPFDVAHVTLTYRVPQCPTEHVEPLPIPAMLITYQHGLSSVDLARLIRSGTWESGLLTTLCPAS